ncbi:hypothetical protein DYH09_11910 [bacterium CPR1]|nr:hypothetical protein [bacterium CPR1]
MVTYQLVGGPEADKSLVQVTVEARDHARALQAGREAAEKVVRSLVGTSVTGCRVIDCQPRK